MPGPKSPHLLCVGPKCDDQCPFEFLTCTLLDGHDGDHESWTELGWDGDLLATWPQAPKPFVIPTAS